MRGVGLLGLVQALYLVMTPDTLPLAKEVHKLSLDPNQASLHLVIYLLTIDQFIPMTQEFPMMVLCINISRIVLHILRDNLLDKMVKDADNVWEVANKLYTGVVLHIYHIWKTQVISTIELVILITMGLSRNNFF